MQIHNTNKYIFFIFKNNNFIAQPHLSLYPPKYQPVTKAIVNLQPKLAFLKVKQLVLQSLRWPFRIKEGRLLVVKQLVLQ